MSVSLSVFEFVLKRWLHDATQISLENEMTQTFTRNLIKQQNTANRYISVRLYGLYHITVSINSESESKRLRKVGENFKG